MRSIFHSEMCNEKWLSHSLSCQIVMGLYLQESHIQVPEPAWCTCRYTVLWMLKQLTALLELVWILEEQHIQEKPCRDQSVLSHPSQKDVEPMSLYLTCYNHAQSALK